MRTRPDVVVIDLYQPTLEIRTGSHEHHCPECFASVPCRWSCTIEPDQCEPGVDRGAVAACDDCEGLS